MLSVLAAFMMFAGCSDKDATREYEEKNNGVIDVKEGWGVDFKIDEIEINSGFTSIGIEAKFESEEGTILHTKLMGDNGQASATLDIKGKDDYKTGTAKCFTAETYYQDNDNPDVPCADCANKVVIWITTDESWIIKPGKAYIKKYGFLLKEKMIK